MPMDARVLALVGAVVFLSAVAQSAVGFGYALYATAPLVWLGLPLPQTVVLVGTCSLLLSIIGARRLRARVPWRMVGTAVAVRLVAVVVGLSLLRWLLSAEQGTIKAAVGAILCAIVLVQWAWRPRPAPQVAAPWGALAFASSGLLAGFCGMGGPPLVLWLMAHDWPSQKTRGFLFATFSLSIPAQLAMMTFTFGASVLFTVAVGLLCLPLVYAGSLVGMPVGDRLSRGALRKCAYAILLAIGITSILAAVCV